MIILILQMSKLWKVYKPLKGHSLLTGAGEPGFRGLHVEDQVRTSYSNDGYGL